MTLQSLSADVRFEPGMTSRRGLTLLEVIVSMTIFLIALGAILPLIQMGQMRALDIEIQTIALQKCQSKLAEVIVGAEPLASQSDMAFDDNVAGEEWKWSMDVTQEDVSNLWLVQVKVYLELDSGRIEVALSQMIMDPSIRGGPAQPVPATTDPAATDPATTDPAGTTTTGGTTTGGTTTGSTTGSTTGK